MDAFERLRALNPVPDPSAWPEPGRDPGAVRVLERVVVGGRRERTRRRHLRNRVFLLPVAGAAALAVAAAGFVGEREPVSFEVVACFRNVDLTGEIAAVGPVRGQVPVEFCADRWQAAFPSDPIPPEFVPCVLDSGVVGVFPGEGGNPCERLGLADAVLAPEYLAVARTLDRTIDVTVGRCVAIEDAQREIRQVLAEGGLGEWRVEPAEAQGHRRDRPCASVAIDGGAKTVTLVPLPPDSAG